jgi:hypothetical protein
MKDFKKVYEAMIKRSPKRDEIIAAECGMTLDRFRGTREIIRHVEKEFNIQSRNILRSFVEKKLSEGSEDFSLSKTEVQAVENIAKSAVYHKLTGRVVSDDTNLDKGERNLTLVTNREPLNPEEIIKLLKIDTTKWYLAGYWNKQQSIGWRVSANVVRIKEKPVDKLAQVIQSWKPRPISKITALGNAVDSEPCMVVISMQDLHFGKRNNDSIRKDYLSALEYLITQSVRVAAVEEVLLVLGGDLLNMDTFDGTTTKGTPVENGLLATETYRVALDTKIEAITLCAQLVPKVRVVYIPGNHDRLSSFHLMDAVTRIFQKNPQIQFDNAYQERKAILYGKNFIGLEHGDVSIKQSPMVFATEFSKAWGTSVYRTLYTGHLHKNKKVEYVVEDETNGLDVKIMPSLCCEDYYHKHNKWTGNKRRGIAEVHKKSGGILAQFHFFADSQKKGKTRK